MSPGPGKSVLGTMFSYDMLSIFKTVVLLSLVADSASIVTAVAATQSSQHDGKNVLLDWKGALHRSMGAVPATSRMSSWTDGSDMCYDWVGTFCNGAGQLDLLNLNGDGVARSLPVELSRVTSLRSLLLAGNEFTGTLPRQWSTLSGLLTVDLSSGNLSGPLPEEWSTMKDLEFALFRDNRLSSTLPKSWSTMHQLHVLDIANNWGVSGKLPPQWSTMKSLMWLDAPGTGLSGRIPDKAWGQDPQQGMTSLNRLDFRNINRSVAGEGALCNRGLISDRIQWVALLDECK